MSPVALAVASVLLAIERVSYVLIGRAPRAFMVLCARPGLARLGRPITIVEGLFYTFKALQFSVFFAWCYLHAGGLPIPAHADPLIVGLAGALVLIGQVLVAATFYRLGRIGVFFGEQLGYLIPRYRKFPFSVLSHPQYVGTVLTIWGAFLLLRFPHDDWFALPLLETVYYVAGAWLEVPRVSRMRRAALRRPGILESG